MGVGAIKEPGDEGASHGEDDVLPIPEAVWRRFLEDTESAIRISAPREPSAWERAAWLRTDPPDASVPGRPTGYDSPSVTPKERRAERPGAIGEVWELEELGSAPEWQDMDSRARLRHVGRVLAAVAAVVAAVVALSCQPSRPVSDVTNGNGVSEQADDVSTGEVPTDAPLPAVFADEIRTG